jgi:putative hemolysin
MMGLIHAPTHMLRNAWQAGRLAMPKPVSKPVRDHGTLDPCLGHIGALEVRLATTKKDIRRAQKLRYRVFFEEGGAIADARASLARRDICPFDRWCDHILVIDHAHVTRFGRLKPKVVGTYRLLRQEVAEQHGGFYSAQEFDLAPLLARHAGTRFLELGRSCVLPEYRSKRTIELLWRGIAAYMQHYRIDAMIGCASFEGTNALAHAQALSFLHHHAQADGNWAARALPNRFVSMDMMMKEAIDLRAALDALPTLIRGYLRIGAKFGAGAVIDHQFGTTDVLVILPIAAIDAKYLDYFSPVQRAA